ncbi:uncharacterized protein LOC143292166 [Babylonia areolata]|uniref:uncharacterized protein LOC143292166 n=1 Tax=Babylonia areolata TaxID=304850 RepID=UPI003FD26564
MAAEFSNEITLADFDCLGGLGMGAFGTVHLVRPSRQARWKQPRGFLAIKEQQKDEVFKDLHQTEVNICRDVREYYNGGSLLQHIKARTVFNGRQMALLAAELSVAILYLQNNSIVHRDIKPDNIIFDGNGHSKIIDFGVACYEWWDSPGIHEPMGTSIYLAPEMFKEPVLYNGMVDWWALGVTLLALVHKVDPMDLFEGPLKSTGQQKRGGFLMAPGLTHFRLGMFSQPLKTFIQGLLVEDPAHRLGVEGERQIRKQRLFHAGGILSTDLKWEALRRGKCPPPLEKSERRQPKLLEWLQLTADCDGDDNDYELSGGMGHNYNHTDITGSMSEGDVLVVTCNSNSQPFDGELS